MQYKISASILSADFARLGQEVENMLAAGADSIHFDVMDNHYVNNLTIGPLVCESLRNFGIKADIDVHLMTEPVDPLIEAFSKVGASAISFHPEATKDLEKSLNLIRDNNIKAGVALNPETDINILEPIIDKLNFVLLMSVHPGFAGQDFIESSLEKITSVDQLLKHHNKRNTISIAVDGGVKPKNIVQIAKAGADTFVMGSALFKSDDYKNTIAKIRHSLED